MLIRISDKTCKVHGKNYRTSDFRTTVIKPYLKEGCPDLVLNESDQLD
jgi:hypothetical protein